MRNLEESTLKSNDIYPMCVNNYTDEDKKERLNNCLEYIISQEKLYIELKREKRLYSLIDEICEKYSVEKRELKALYKEKFSAINSPGRNSYMNIRTSSPRGTCPLCGQRKVSTLDHYLAQTHYPSLVLSSINLVPSCIDCNKLKLSHKATNHHKETFHPYFDDLGTDRFLFMSIEENIDITLNFSIIKPITWDDDLFLRMSNHFTSMKLNELYISHALDEIVGNILTWKNLNPQDLKDQLNDSALAKSRIDLNCWQVAFYSGLAESEWFCNVDLEGLSY